MLPTPQGTDNVAAVTTNTLLESDYFVLKEREGRGRCLVATNPISQGQQIEGAGGSDSLFQPLVPPVLLQSQRKTRCAVCFEKLSSPSALRLDNDSIYPVYVCSKLCLSRHAWIQEEHQTIRLARQASGRRSTTNKAVPLLSTAILVYRIVRQLLLEKTQNNPSMFEHQVASMQAYDGTSAGSVGSNDKKGEDIHCQAIITTVQALITQWSRLPKQKTHLLDNQTLQSIVGADAIAQLVSKVKINAFTVCDGEFQSLGAALYPTANFFNHSCRPNALQTFLYGQAGRPPRLCVTACRPIAPGDEICIAYTDSHCPSTHRRRHILEENYHFRCRCEACLAGNGDCARFGIKCPNCKKGIATAVSADSEAEGGNDGDGDEVRLPSNWECNSCNDRVDVTEACKVIRKWKSDQGDNLATAERVHATNKRLLVPSSWYFQESGEKLLQCLLNELSKPEVSSSEQEFVCKRALAVANDMVRGYDDTSEDDASVLREGLLRFKAARLRLFLEADPRRPIVEIQAVLLKLSRYYPPNHPLVLYLRQSLEAAF